MYTFHYTVWKKAFPKSKLLFTDTDSLAYVTPGCTSSKLKSMKKYFDFSNLEKSHFLYDEENIQKTGKFKNEIPFSEFVGFAGLRPKLYSILCEQGNGLYTEQKVAKGIKKCVKNKNLTFQNFKNTLLTKSPKSVQINNILSKDHRLYSIQQSKLALSVNDTKRYILEDGISTLAIGHYRTREKVGNVESIFT